MKAVTICISFMLCAYGQTEKSSKHNYAGPNSGTTNTYIQLTPSIDPNDAAEFWRAQAQLLEVAPEFQKRNAVLQAARAKLDKACGESHRLIDDGKLKCELKPVDPAKPSPAPIK